MILRLVPLALLTTLVLPPMTFVVLTASSMTIGLLACAFVWLLVALGTGRNHYVVRKTDAYGLLLLAGALALLTAHAFISSLLVGGVDFGRLFFSFGIASVLLSGAYFASRKLARVSDATLVRAADLVLTFLTLLAIAALAGVPAVGPQVSPKAVVLFAEPSHFGLAYMPVLLFRVSVSKRRTQALLIGMAFLLAIALQSLTMLAGILIEAALVLRAVPLILTMAVVVGGLFTVDVSYYSSRLAFSSDTDNLSTLVFLQGWENAILNFVDTRGFGVGFQQFGIAGSTGEVTDRIAELLGTNISLLDGGSTATKLIGEFGIFGIVFIAAFMRLVIRGALYLRRSQQIPAAARNQRKMFFYAFIVSYVVELFVRGLGYFSPAGFLVAIALISLTLYRPHSNATGRRSLAGKESRNPTQSLEQTQPTAQPM